MVCRALLVVLLLAPGAVSAAPRVLSQRSAWNAARTHIYTERLVELADGRRELVRVPGGVVDGIGMVEVALNGTFYVPTRTSGGAPLRWRGSCVFLTPDSAGTADLPLDTTLDIIDASAAAWEDGGASCGYLRFVVNAATSGEVGYDGTNRIKFRDARWCRPASGSEPEECHEPGAAALTTIFYQDDPGSADDGRILDADIEINAVTFNVVSCTTACPATTGTNSDLGNTLTHELGHVVGLDHTCWDGTGTQPRDGDGALVPSCGGALPASILEATMYPYQDDGEIAKATLEADDVAGFCDAYPKASDPAVCEPVDLDGGCCAVGGGRPGGVAVGLLLGLAALLRLRTTRR